MSWETSNRRTRLPKNWAHLVAATRERAGGLCEATQHDSRCDGYGNDCDHDTPGDNHSLTNLRWLNHWCHQAKTTREATAARAKARAATQRSTEPHPGKLT